MTSTPDAPGPDQPAADAVALPDPAGLPEGGFGWFLIQDLTQALCYYRRESRNYLAFNIPFAADGEG